MIEILGPLIANGSTWTLTDLTYQPWLPFYNFIPIILVAGVVISVLTRKLFWGVNFMASSLLSLIPTWMVWRTVELEPTAVFIVWGINTAFMIWLQCFMITRRKRMLKELKPGQDHDHRFGGGDFETYEKYMEHIKTVHPDIWKEYHEENENES